MQKKDEKELRKRLKEEEREMIVTEKMKERMGFEMKINHTDRQRG
jgi:hypothetical protein